MGGGDFISFQSLEQRQQLFQFFDNAFLLGKRREREYAFCKIVFMYSLLSGCTCKGFDTIVNKIC